MPRRNFYLLLLVTVVSLVCYQKADSRHRRMHDTLTEVMRQIERHYLEPVDDQSLFQGALDGLVKQLDPYSAYIGPQDTRQFREGLDQQFGGIGIEVSWDAERNVLTVLNPLVGTPAYEGGVLAGDRILAIEGEKIERFNLEEAVRRLRGKPGDPVRLTILHEGADEPVEIVLVRAVVKVDSVIGYRRHGEGIWSFTLPGHPEIGYMRVTSFGKRTVDETQAVLDKLRDDGIRALVLDLRFNAGGLLEAGTEVCDLFIASGTIVTTRGRNGEILERVEATGQAPYADWPLVVLVNRYSASAAEIVAACLQDHQRAIIVGERTWGKGTVQNLIPLEGGRSALKLTVASYWRPSGKNIHRRKDAPETADWGVQPDDGFEVKLTDDQMRSLAEGRRRRERQFRDQDVGPEEGTAAEAPMSDDPQLEAAVGYLLEKFGTRPAVASQGA